MLPLLGLGDLRTRVSWFMETKRGADVLDPHWTRTDKYGLLNARMALELADGLTEVTLYCTNCLGPALLHELLQLRDPRHGGPLLRAATHVRHRSATRVLDPSIRRIGRSQRQLM